MFDYFKRPKKIIKCPFYGVGCDHEYVVIDQMVEHLQLESYNHNKSLIELLESLKYNLENLKKSDEENKNEIAKLKSNEKLRDQMISTMNQEIKSIRAENQLKISENSKAVLEKRIDEIKSVVEEKNIDKIKSIFYEMESRQIDNIKQMNEIESIKIKIDKTNSKIEEIDEQLKDHSYLINKNNKKYEEVIEKNILEHESLTLEIEVLRAKLEQTIAGMNAEEIEWINNEIKVAMKEGKILGQQIQNFQQKMNENMDKVTTEMNSKRNELKQEWRNILEEKLSKINEEQNQYQMEIINRIHQTENYLEKIIDGILMWKIDKIFDKRKNSKTVFSKYFYPRIYPYKMLLAIRMYDKHFNASLIICHNSNNFNLPWPFKGRLTIKITNHNIPGICKIMTNVCQISRPFNNYFNCSEALVFLFSDLQHAGLLHGDCFLVECFVNEV